MSTRSRIAIAIAVAIPFAAGYGWNVWRNVDALARAERACARIRTARASAWASLEQPAAGLFGDDLPLVMQLFAELGDEPCREVPRRLGSPLAWRGGATWTGAPYPADRLDALAAASERARARCPGLFAPFLATVGSPAGAEGAARAACEDIMAGFDAYAAETQESRDPVALWDWPARLEHLAATLESVPPP